MVALEQQHNINKRKKKDKKRFRPKKSQEINTNSNNILADSTWQIWIQASIEYGTTWLDF